MPFEIRPAGRDGICQIIFTGSVDAAEWQSATAEGLRCIEGLNPTGILIDLSQVGDSLMGRDEFELGLTISETADLPDVRIAFLDSPENRERSWFLVIIERCQGLTARHFTSREPALKTVPR